MGKIAEAFLVDLKAIVERIWEDYDMDAAGTIAALTEENHAARRLSSASWRRLVDVADLVGPNGPRAPHSANSRLSKSVATELPPLLRTG